MQRFLLGEMPIKGKRELPRESWENQLKTMQSYPKRRRDERQIGWKIVDCCPVRGTSSSTHAWGALHSKSAILRILCLSGLDLP
jgi:hypothetical protein